MQVLGLTGGIAMGKSTLAAILRRAGAAVFDADATVRRLQAPGGAALPAIAALVPGTVADGRLDRTALRRALAIDPGLLPALEAVIHPLVRRALRRFLLSSRRRGVRLAVLDVPLLFEGELDRLCDAVVTASAPAAVQQARLRRRGTLSAEQMRLLIARQWPDAARRFHADSVVRTGLSRKHGRDQLLRFLHFLRLAPRRRTIRRWNAPSCSTPKPPASIPKPATAFLRSRRSN